MNEDDGKYPAVIWLQPWCDVCETHCHNVETGRQWCAEDVWEPCEECGNVAVKYVIAPDEVTK